MDCNQLVVGIDPVDDNFFYFGQQHPNGVSKFFEIYTDCAYDLFGKEVFDQLKRCKEPMPVEINLKFIPIKVRCSCECHKGVCKHYCDCCWHGRGEKRENRVIEWGRVDHA
jgi:hypothetical protein